jgi:hypothetical protein
MSVTLRVAAAGGAPDVASGTIPRSHPYFSPDRRGEDKARPALTTQRFRQIPGDFVVEASLDIAMLEAGDLFRDDTTDDPIARLERADTALHDAIIANETALRIMLAHSLQRRVTGGGDDELPTRQNRRTPLIEAALAPAGKDIRPAAMQTLRNALALVIGTEAMLVCKDVLELDDAETRGVKRWTIRALVQAARESGARD